MASLLIGFDSASGAGSGTYAYAWATRLVATKSGNVTELRYKSNDTSGLVKLALYTNESDYPHDLLAANSTSTSTVNGWVSLAITSTPIVEGTTYWIVAAINHDTYIYYGAGYRRLAIITYDTFTFADPSDIDDASENYSCAVAGWGTAFVNINVSATLATATAKKSSHGVNKSIKISSLMNSIAKRIFKKFETIKLQDVLSITELKKGLKSVIRADILQTCSNLAKENRFVRLSKAIAILAAKFVTGHQNYVEELDVVIAAMKVSQLEWISGFLRSLISISISSSIFGTVGISKNLKIIAVLESVLDRSIKIYYTFKSISILSSKILKNISRFRDISAYMILETAKGYVYNTIRNLATNIELLVNLLNGKGKTLYANLVGISVLDIIQININRILFSVINLKNRFQDYVNDIETLRVNLVMLPSQLFREIELSRTIFAIGVFIAKKVFNIYYDTRLLITKYILTIDLKRILHDIETMIPDAITLAAPVLVNYTIRMIRILRTRIIALVRLLNGKGKTIISSIILNSALDRLFSIEKILSAINTLLTKLPKDIENWLEEVISEMVVVATKSYNINMNRILSTVGILAVEKIFTAYYNRIIRTVNKLRSTISRIIWIDRTIKPKIILGITMTRGFFRLLVSLVKLLVTREDLAKYIEILTSAIKLVSMSIIRRLFKHYGHKKIRIVGIRYERNRQ